MQNTHTMQNGNVLTKEMLEQMLVECGRLWKNVAAKLGISVSQVLRIRKKLGCAVRSVARDTSWFHSNIDEIKRMAEVESLPAREIVRLLDLPVGQSALQSRMRMNGIKASNNRRGKFSGHWKGGRTTDGKGYVLLYKPDHPNAKMGKYVAEHRLIMESRIGRFLRREEVVHHIDGNPGNNDPDNLMLFPTNSEHHQYEERLAAWAKLRFGRQYAEMINTAIPPESKNGGLEQR